MDVLLQASKVSSLQRALQNSTTIDPYVPRVPKSTPAIGIETLIVPSIKQGHGTEDITHQIQIPKAGILQSMFVRFTLKGARTSTDTKTTANVPDGKRLYAARGGLGYVLAKRLRLLSNSRELCAMDSAAVKILVDRLPTATRAAMNRLAAVGIEADQYCNPASALVDKLFWYSTSSPSRDLTVYCPVPFSVCMPNSKNIGSTSLDTSFLETLTLEVQTRAFLKCLNKGAGPAVEPQSMDVALVANFFQLNDADRQKVIARSYKAGRPTQILSTNWVKIGNKSEEKAALGDKAFFKPQQFEVNTSCAGLIRSLAVVVRVPEGETSSDMGAGVGLATEFGMSHACDWQARIRDVTFETGGRTIINKLSPEEALSSSIRIGNGANPFADGAENNSFVYRFATDLDTSRYSGAAAGSGLSSQKFTVNADLVRATGATGLDTKVADGKFHYSCDIYVELVSVLSISPSDGSIKKSLST